MSSLVNIHGKELYSVSDIVADFLAYPNDYPLTYKVRYAFGAGSTDAYAGARLERPKAFAGNDPHSVYPWESLLVAAANCAGSDYPMLGEHYDVPVDGVEIELTAKFDPRGEFAGLSPELPDRADLQHCYVSFHWKATIVSPASKDKVAKVHERALARNMVLDALRAVPITNELVVKAAPKARGT